ncbi:MAG: helix-turn-helix domain-containing protein [Flavisolibacter sp.]
MTEVQLLKKIGQRIKQIREEKGITQDNLGISMSLGKRAVKEYDKSNVSRLESGKLNPRIFTLYRVAKALDVSLDELLRVE